MKKLFRIILLILMGITTYSCYYDAFPELEIIDSPEPIENVSFINDVQPLFSRCIGCHNGSLEPDLREGSSYNALVPQYVTAGNANNSDLFINLPGNNHPIDVGFTLSVSEIATIEAWINEGASNN